MQQLIVKGRTKTNGLIISCLMLSSQWPHSVYRRTAVDVGVAATTMIMHVQEALMSNNEKIDCF